jgi:NAD(P)-dependent dehydrogenase (short-subunit alcohol dehydrogenase family)
VQAAQPDPADLAACLRVLGLAAERPDDPALAAVTAAVDRAYRAGKKRRKADRLAARRAHNRALMAGARRYREEVPPVTPGAAPGAEQTARTERELRGSRRCYVCKNLYTRIDAEYHMLCPPCAAENLANRNARADLTGRRAVVTGGRIKIGFHTALKLLRDGASVLVTTRFPADAARRFASVPDAPDWLDRLWVHGVDLLDLGEVVGLVEAVRERWGELDILVNNAAQTIRRPAGYHREVRAAEADPLRGLAAAVERTDGRRAGTGADLVPSADALFPPGLRDESGEPLDLRGTNSWALHVDEVTPAEWLETHVVNAFVPFLLTGQLRAQLAKSRFPDRYVVQVSAMEGSFSRPTKTPRHPHTNMAKAALNMLTRTVAAEYAADGIYMSSVDTGWVTDERPHPGKTAERAAGFRPPLDVVDGAARVYDPVVRGVGGAPVYGVFLKDYRQVRW